MPLPSCICVAGRPPFERLGDIFCALSQIDLECVVPTLVSASINEDVVTLNFSEEVTGTTGFAIEIDGLDEIMTYVSGEGTSTLIFQSGGAASPGVTVLLDYAPGNVQSGPECPLAAFTDFNVTNNTGMDFFFLRPNGVDSYLRPGGVDTYLRP